MSSDELVHLNKHVTKTLSKKKLIKIIATVTILINTTNASTTTKILLKKEQNKFW